MRREDGFVQVGNHERIDHAKNRPRRHPPATLASTAPTSPRTITMYLPEQMERDSSSSTAAAFSIASLT